LLLQFKLMSHDVFDQFKTNGVLDPAVDVAFNPLHHRKTPPVATSLMPTTLRYHTHKLGAVEQLSPVVMTSCTTAWQ
jgi:hypothetical protein